MAKAGEKGWARHMFSGQSCDPLATLRVSGPAGALTDLSPTMQALGPKPEVDLIPPCVYWFSAYPHTYPRARKEGKSNYESGKGRFLQVFDRGGGISYILGVYPRTYPRTGLPESHPPFRGRFRGEPAASMTLGLACGAARPGGHPLA